jgi:FMN-dependent oxidoreductase (nitrilotriacetate monooxygenase family)
MSRVPMILSAFFFNPQGDHRMSWRHPHAPGREIFGLEYYRQLALTAEHAVIDTIFIADHVAIWDSFESTVAHYANARLEPITLLSALAAATRHIGLIGTASSSYSEPYNLARAFASLDYLSDGRAGWNVVTSGMDEEALNFGKNGNIEHAIRYERAAEFLDTAKALWDSWEDDAILMDKASGYFADPKRVHRIDHVGKHFKVRGPLNVPRPIQGHPVIVQAGSSEDGKKLAAAHADLHFSLVRNIDEGKQYRLDLDERLRQAGRTPASLKILPGIVPIVAESASAAREKQEQLESLMPIRIGVDLLSSWCGVDLSKFPLDGPLPTLPPEETFDGQRTNLVRVREFAEQNLTIRQTAQRVSRSGTAPLFAGTARDIADQLEAWFTAGAADGFNLMFPLMAEDWTNFAGQVVPELQRRGLARTEYGTETLRERLGLPRPVNRFAASKPGEAVDPSQGKPNQLVSSAH